MRQGQVKRCMQLVGDWLQSKGTDHGRNGRQVDGIAEQELGGAGADAGMCMLTAKESVAAAAAVYVEVAGYETTK